MTHPTHLSEFKEYSRTDKGIKYPKSIKGAAGIRVNRFSLYHKSMLYRVYVKKTCLVEDIRYCHSKYPQHCLHFINLKKMACSRTPEDPKHPACPITSQLKKIKNRRKQ